MSYRYLSWFRQQERITLDAVLTEQKGYELLLLGKDDLSAVSSSPVKHKFAAIFDTKSRLALCSEYESLPLANESLDVIVIWHVLDTYQQPMLLLKELKRVLRPDGQLVLVGVNPNHANAEYVSQRQTGIKAKSKLNSLCMLKLAALEADLIVAEQQAFCGVAKFTSKLQPKIDAWACRYLSHLALGYCWVLKPESLITLTPELSRWRKRKLEVTT